mmetsp:Transcript_82866/g.238105  ORF Transcript_82866/g.238105 Transcript_82866/m.238105 type:complete len:298 (-) Transcript_82866:272-1165(-)
MAADEPYTLLLSLDGAGAPFRQGIDAEDLRLSFGSQHNRKNHILDTLIEKQWGAAVARNPRTFDGSKFRLDGITWVEGGCAVEFRFGLTSYKEYLGTNRLEDAQFLQLRRDGEESHGDACAHLSNALGCEALLLTSDRQVVLLRRSAAVGTHGGLYNGPSGHPEPGSAGLPKDGVAALGATVGGEEADVVRRELFKSVLDEISAETNVPHDSLTQPKLIGCMADVRGKPDVLFFVQTTLDAAAVRECYDRGAEEGWESDRLTFMSEADLASCALPMTAVTRVAIACFLEMTRASGDS